MGPRSIAIFRTLNAIGPIKSAVINPFKSFCPLAPSDAEWWGPPTPSDLSVNSVYSVKAVMCGSSTSGSSLCDATHDFYFDLSFDMTQANGSSSLIVPQIIYGGYKYKTKDFKINIVASDTLVNIPLTRGQNYISYYEAIVDYGMRGYYYDLNEGRIYPLGDSDMDAFITQVIPANQFNYKTLRTNLTDLAYYKIQGSDTSILQVNMIGLINGAFFQLYPRNQGITCPPGSLRNPFTSNTNFDTTHILASNVFDVFNSYSISSSSSITTIRSLQLAYGSTTPPIILTSTNPTQQNDKIKATASYKFTRSLASLSTKKLLYPSGKDYRGAMLIESSHFGQNLDELGVLPSKWLQQPNFCSTAYGTGLKSQISDFIQRGDSTFNQVLDPALWSAVQGISRNGNGSRVYLKNDNTLTFQLNNDPASISMQISQSLVELMEPRIRIDGVSTEPSTESSNPCIGAFFVTMVSNIGDEDGLFRFDLNCDQSDLSYQVISSFQTIQSGESAKFYTALNIHRYYSAIKCNVSIQIDRQPLWSTVDKASSAIYTVPSIPGCSNPDPCIGQVGEPLLGLGRIDVTIEPDYVPYNQVTFTKVYRISLPITNEGSASGNFGSRIQCIIKSKDPATPNYFFLDEVTYTIINIKQGETKTAEFFFVAESTFMPYITMSFSITTSLDKPNSCVGASQLQPAIELPPYIWRTTNVTRLYPSQIILGTPWTSGVVTSGLPITPVTENSIPTSDPNFSHAIRDPSFTPTMFRSNSYLAITNGGNDGAIFDVIVVCESNHIMIAPEIDSSYIGVAETLLYTFSWTSYPSNVANSTVKCLMTINANANGDDECYGDDIGLEYSQPIWVHPPFNPCAVCSGFDTLVERDLSGSSCKLGSDNGALGCYINYRLWSPAAPNETTAITFYLEVKEPVDNITPIEWTIDRMHATASVSRTIFVRNTGDGVGRVSAITNKILPLSNESIMTASLSAPIKLLDIDIQVMVIDPSPCWSTVNKLLTLNFQASSPFIPCAIGEPSIAVSIPLIRDNPNPATQDIHVLPVSPMIQLVDPLTYATFRFNLMTLYNVQRPIHCTVTAQFNMDACWTNYGKNMAQTVIVEFDRPAKLDASGISDRHDKKYLAAILGMYKRHRAIKSYSAFSNPAQQQQLLSPLHPTCICGSKIFSVKDFEVQQRSNPALNTKQSAPSIRRSLVNLSTELSRLIDNLTYGNLRITEKESLRRRGLVESLITRKNNLATTFEGANNNTAAKNELIGDATGRRAWGKSKETEQTQDMNNQQVFDSQKHIMNQQDESLDVLSQSLMRQKNMAHAMNNELGGDGDSDHEASCYCRQIFMFFKAIDSSANESLLLPLLNFKQTDVTRVLSKRLVEEISRCLATRRPSDLLAYLAGSSLAGEAPILLTALEIVTRASSTGLPRSFGRLLVVVLSRLLSLPSATLSAPTGTTNPRAKHHIHIAPLTELTQVIVYTIKSSSRLLVSLHDDFDANNGYTILLNTFIHIADNGSLRSKLDIINVACNLLFISLRKESIETDSIYQPTKTSLKVFNIFINVFSITKSEEMKTELLRYIKGIFSLSLVADTSSDNFDVLAGDDSIGIFHQLEPFKIFFSQFDELAISNRRMILEMMDELLVKNQIKEISQHLTDLLSRGRIDKDILQNAGLLDLLLRFVVDPTTLSFVSILETQPDELALCFSLLPGRHFHTSNRLFVLYKIVTTVLTLLLEFFGASHAIQASFVEAGGLKQLYRLLPDETRMRSTSNEVFFFLKVLIDTLSAVMKNNPTNQTYFREEIQFSTLSNTLKACGYMEGVYSASLCDSLLNMAVSVRRGRSYTNDFDRNGLTGSPLPSSAYSSLDLATDMRAGGAGWLATSKLPEKCSLALAQERHGSCQACRDSLAIESPEIFKLIIRLMGGSDEEIQKSETNVEGTVVGSRDKTCELQLALDNGILTYRVLQSGQANVEQYSFSEYLFEPDTFYHVAVTHAGVGNVTGNNSRKSPSKLYVNGCLRGHSIESPIVKTNWHLGNAYFFEDLPTERELFHLYLLGADHFRGLRVDISAIEHARPLMDRANKFHPLLIEHLQAPSTAPLHTLHDKIISIFSARALYVTKSHRIMNKRFNESH
eukprot:gene15259-18065_t